MLQSRLRHEKPVDRSTARSARRSWPGSGWDRRLGTCHIGWISSDGCSRATPGPIGELCFAPGLCHPLLRGLSALRRERRRLELLLPEVMIQLADWIREVAASIVALAYLVPIGELCDRLGREAVTDRKVGVDITPAG